MTSPGSGALAFAAPIRQGDIRGRAMVPQDRRDRGRLHGREPQGRDRRAVVVVGRHADRWHGGCGRRWRCGQGRRSRTSTSCRASARRRPSCSSRVRRARITRRRSLSGVRVGGKGPSSEFLKYKLSDVVVTSDQHAGNEGDFPVEQFSLNYSKIEISFTPQTATGPRARRSRPDSTSRRTRRSDQSSDQSNDGQQESAFDRAGATPAAAARARSGGSTSAMRAASASTAPSGRVPSHAAAIAARLPST